MQGFQFVERKLFLYNFKTSFFGFAPRESSLNNKFLVTLLGGDSGTIGSDDKYYKRACLRKDRLSRHSEVSFRPFGRPALETLL